MLIELGNEDLIEAFEKSVIFNTTKKHNGKDLSEYQQKMDIQILENCKKELLNRLNDPENRYKRVS